MRPEPTIERYTMQQVKQRLDRGDRLLLMDVRPQPDTTQIRGAVYYDPADLLAAETVHLPVPKDTLIVTYCTDPGELTSATIARRLIEHGYPNTHPLLGGYVAWRRRKVGYPIESRARAQVATPGMP